MKFDLNKRARELFPRETHITYTSAGAESLALQLAREALDAQAEEIAEWCRDEARWSKYWQDDASAIAYLRFAQHLRSIISKPDPEKTREQELEETLWTATRNMKCYCEVDAPCIRCRARRLLEKKP